MKTRNEPSGAQDRPARRAASGNLQRATPATDSAEDSEYDQNAQGFTSGERTPELQTGLGDLGSFATGGALRRG
jgi:hypothetical protein